MVKNSHQRQQSEQSPLSSDGKQFTPISTKRTHISKNSDVQQFHQYQQSEQSSLSSDGQQFHQYQQSEQSPLNSDFQQFTPISTKRTMTCKQ
jgi:hypothetical protein